MPCAPACSAYTMSFFYRPPPLTMKAVVIFVKAAARQRRQLDFWRGCWRDDVLITLAHNPWRHAPARHSRHARVETPHLHARARFNRLLSSRGASAALSFIAYAGPPVESISSAGPPPPQPSNKRVICVRPSTSCAGLFLSFALLERIDKWASTNKAGRKKISGS